VAAWGSSIALGRSRCSARWPSKVVSPALVGDASFAERFKREARIAASIEHASVVPIYGAGEEDGRLYLVMRFVEGTDLFAEVAGHGPLAQQRVARLAGQLAGALDAAHARGLVHRDVKPANVLLTGTGDDEHALLTDFGLSKEAAGVSGLTGTGQLLGTLDYVAPLVSEGVHRDPAHDGEVDPGLGQCRQEPGRPKRRFVSHRAGPSGGSRAPRRAVARALRCVGPVSAGVPVAAG